MASANDFLLVIYSVIGQELVSWTWLYITAYDHWNFLLFIHQK